MLKRALRTRCYCRGRIIAVLRRLLMAFLGAGLLVGIVAADEVPLPTSRSTTLRAGDNVYVVKGRVKIPKGVKLLCQKGVRIVGRGEDPTLEVEGFFEAHGIRDQEVALEGIHIELTPRFEGLRLAFAVLRSGGGIRTAEKKPVSGRLHLEDVKFQGKATLNIELTGGLVEIKRTSAVSPVQIRAVDSVKGKPNTARLDCFWCFAEYEFVSGFHGGLLVNGVNDVRVRWCRLGGEQSLFQNCRKFVLEACKLDSSVVAIEQSLRGQLGKTKVLKCDVYSETLRVKSPPAKKKELVQLDSCYFKHGSTVKQIHETIEDANDDPQTPNGAIVRIKKVLKRPLKLGGTDRPR